MPNPSERKRLKDRIVESVSKAVKQIQRLHSEAGEDTLLCNDDWQFQRLVEHLDHALLHGLKHITNGYWVLVREFTPKSTVTEIERLTNVTTNLGKGRAWLYLALGDRLLESYLNCYMNEQARVSKFYMKEALVLDHDRMHVLLTVSMGLEHVTFQLELDKPYLDLASHVRLRSTSMNEEDDTTDRISLSSMNSQLSLSSCTTAELGIDVASLADLETISNGSSDVEVASQKCVKLAHSYSLPMLQGTTPPTRIDRISSIQPRMSVDLDLTKSIHSQDAIGSLEVIRHKVKVPKSRRKSRNTKHRKRDSDSLSSADMDKTVSCDSNETVRLSARCNANSHVQPSPLTPESGYKSVVENSSPTSKLVNGQIPTEQNTDRLGTTHKTGPEKLFSGRLDAEDSVTWSDDSGTASHMSVENSNNGQKGVENSTGDDSLLDRTNSSHNIESDFRDVVHGSSQIQCNADNNLEMENSISLDTSDVENSTLVDGLESSQECVYDMNRSAENSLDSSGTISTNNVIFNKHSSASSKTISDSVSSSCKHSASHDLTRSGEITGNRAKHTPTNSSKLPYSPGSLSNQKDAVDGASKSNKGHNANTDQTVMETLCPWDIKVDNNTKLLLMLNVFQAEEESFIKMFSTCLGHTEGDVQPVLLILTDRTLYFTAAKNRNLFKKYATVHFKEIDYISLSLGYQVLNIVCTNRRKQFWVTTGDSLLTKCIMGHLDNAIRHSEQDLPRLSILTDATNQKIAIQKWAASECRCQKTDIVLVHYSLVYWEDAEPTAAGWLQIEATKEGALYYKSNDSYFAFRAPVWKKGYCILLDGKLHLYREKHDKGTPLLTINLNVQECKGCRMSRESDMANTLEVLRGDGTSLMLAASNLTECQEWLQSLCQAVSEQMGAVSSKGVVVACCLVLTKSRLLTCHEDVQTGFIRTLGSGNVIDITGVQVDPATPHFCVIRFDAPNSHEPEQWVVYFNCVQERDNFLASLDEAWRALFQIALPKSDLEDTALQKRCSDGLLKIRQQRAY